MVYAFPFYIRPTAHDTHDKIPLMANCIAAQIGHIGIYVRAFKCVVVLLTILCRIFSVANGSDLERTQSTSNALGAHMISIYTILHMDKCTVAL